MKKVLKKSVEAEINSVLKNFFHHKNEEAAKKIEKSVNKVSKALSKEFIKNVTKLKKARARKVADSKKNAFQISKSEKMYGVPASKERSESKSNDRPASGARNAASTVSAKRTTRSGSTARKAATAKRSAKKRLTSNR